MSKAWTWGVFAVTGGWVLAQENEATGQMQASMTPAARRLTGCAGVFAATAEGLAKSGNVRVYRSRATPVRLLRAKAREEANERALAAFAASPEELARREREDEAMALEADEELAREAALERAAEALGDA